MTDLHKIKCKNPQERRIIYYLYTTWFCRLKYVDTFGVWKTLLKRKECRYFCCTLPCNFFGSFYASLPSDHAFYLTETVPEKHQVLTLLNKK